MVLRAELQQLEFDVEAQVIVPSFPCAVQLYSAANKSQRSKPNNFADACAVWVKP